MFRMAVGHSDDIDPAVALSQVFAGCDAGLAGARPRAGLLFATFDADHQALVAAVREHYPDIELCGSSAAGEMSSVGGFQEDSIALALFATDDVDVVAGLGTGVLVDPRAAAIQAVADARARSAQEPRLCLALTASTGDDPGAILAYLREALGPDVAVLGGGAAIRDRRVRSEPSYTFVDDTVAVDGIAILLFCGPLAYSFGVDTGWRPVGPQGTVTRSTSTEISEIDGRPAIEFYQHYLGAGEAAAANPLAVSQEGSSGFYLRAPVGFDEDRGSVLVFGDVPEGAHVQLSIAGLDDLLGGTKAAIGRALEAYPSTAPPPSAGLLFSCVIRKVLLGTRTGREVELVRDILGPDVPIAGLYCYGEIAPTGVDEVSRFHNETMVAVLLGSA